MRAFVLCLVLLTAATAPAAAATVSAENAVELNAKRTSACGPEVAWTGSNYLVVWAHRKQAYSALVSPSGALLVGAHLIGPAYADNLYSCPQVSHGSDRALVVWHDPTDIVRAAFVDVTTNQATAAFAVSPGASYRQAHPAVSYDGTSFLVTWQGTTTLDWSQGHIYGRRVSPLGAVLGPELLLTSGVAPRFAPSAAAATARGVWLVTWSEGSSLAARIRGRIVAWDGSFLGPSFAISAPAVSAGQRNVELASDGDGFLVAWFDGAGTGVSHVRGSFVSVAGEVATPAGFQLSDVEVNDSGDAPRVAYNPASLRYLVTWEPQAQRAIRGALVVPGASSATRFAIAATAAPDNFHLGAGVASGAGTSALVAYSRTSSTVPLVFNRIVTLP